MKFKKTTLPNGLRIITVPVKDSPTVTVMVAVETGSDYEAKEINGISHFLEHMCFKGTIMRPRAIDIASEFDGLGAEHNAFTGGEYTGYYAKGQKKNFIQLLDIVSDMYLNPTFPEAALEKEKGVILQEISRVEDEASRKVQRDIMRLMYGDTPEGRSTLGVPRNIKSFVRDDFVKYRNKHYVAAGTLVIIAGDINEKEVIKYVKKYFSSVSTSKKHKKAKIVEKQDKPQIFIRPKNTDLVEAAFGFRTYKGSDKRNIPLEILSNVLGSGMSSRLFQKLRTDLGICYVVGAGSHVSSDHGALFVVSGLEKKRLEIGIEAIINECKKLKEELISEEELNKTKGYMIGHLYLGLEGTDALADFYLEQEITRKRLETPEEIEKQIRMITAKDVQKVAREVFQNKNLNLALVGDVKSPQGIKKLLSV